MKMTGRHPAFAAALRRRIAPLAALAVLAGSAACDGGTGPAAAVVATVTVSPPTGSLQEGATLSLTATPRDADGDALAGKTVTWSTSNPAVATVAAGVVTGVAPGGPVTITATSEGKSGTAAVTVTAIPVAAVELTPLADTLEVGENRQFAAVARSASGGVLAGRAINWSTGDGAVASISPGGLLTAVSPGTTTVTATSEGIAASASIRVAGCPAIPNPAPAGMLTRDAEGFVFTAADGWRIVYRPMVITILTPTASDAIQFWGGIAGFGAIHENLNGKHIKNRLGASRSLILPSGAMITMTAPVSVGELTAVSIYEGDQSHSFDPVTFRLTHSCAGHAPTATAREAAEADGEAATFKLLPDGRAVFTNEYTQGVSATGEPLEKVPGVLLLGETGGPSNPNNVRDYYDDPRLGHT